MKGGTSAAVWLIVLIMLMFMGFMGIYMYSMQLRPAVPVEYEGEFDKIYDPDYVAGTDLSITETSISDGGHYTIPTAFDLNGTDGVTEYLAFGLEITGSNGFEALDIDGGLNSTTSTSELRIKKAYIVPDVEGKTLDQSDALYIGQVNTDQDEFEFDLSAVPKGKYVVCVEVKGISTSTIASKDGLVDIDFDATTEGDISEFSVTLTNA